MPLSRLAVGSTARLPDNGSDDPISHERNELRHADVVNDSAHPAKWSFEESAAFVDQHYARLFAWLAWLTRDCDRAADLTQESFAEFWTSQAKRPIRDPRLWLFSIARNRWRKWRRRSRCDGFVPATALANTVAPCHGDPTGRQERADLIAELVGRLPLAVREAVVLRYWCDLSHREIAAVQGSATVLVRWRVHRGRRLISRWLHDRGFCPEDVT